MDEVEIQKLRKEFKAVQNFVFLNTGTSGPLSDRVTGAILNNLSEQASLGRITLEYYSRVGALKSENRNLIAGLINADPGEIALTGSTSDGLNIVFNGFNWSKDDEVITTNAEHLTVYGPLYNLAARFGIKVKVAEVIDGFENAAETIAGLITDKTRLIVISHILYCTGNKLPVEEISELCHKAGVLLLVDGAQSFCAVDVDVKQLGCDFYAAPGQKWLCGPEETGFLYVSSRAICKLLPLVIGYGSVKGFSFKEGLQLHEDAQKYESGTVQPANLAGFHEAVRFLNEIGFEKIFNRNIYLAEEVYKGLISIPEVKVLNQTVSSPLVSFTVSGIESAKIAEHLLKKKIILRTVPVTNAVRVSAGFFNTKPEIEQLISEIEKIVKKEILI